MILHHRYTEDTEKNNYPQISQTQKMKSHNGFLLSQE